MLSGTCVVYLARINEGLAPVQRFLRAYSSHDSGLPHRLIVLRRGFASNEEWSIYAEAFEEHHVRYDPMDVADDGFDLGAYREAARRSSADEFCFLNTFSEVLCDGWLANLHRAAHLERAGLVGATGSWESMYSSALPRRGAAPVRLPRSAHIRDWFRVRALHGDFAPFPNPHVRTNAFMLSRALALALDWGPLRRKTDAHRTESGRSGLSRQAAEAGLRNLVVGRDGTEYGSDEWPESATFRYRDQANLMVADNRTRDYFAGSDAARRHLGHLAWGDRYQPSEAAPQEPATEAGS